MPIKSYLAIPNEGQKEVLQEDLTRMAACEVIASENKNVLVVVTETANREEDENLFHKLNSLENLQLLTLVSAFSNPPELSQE